MPTMKSPGDVVFGFTCKIDASKRVLFCSFCLGVAHVACVVVVYEGAKEAGTLRCTFQLEAFLLANSITQRLANHEGLDKIG